MLVMMTRPADTGAPVAFGGTTLCKFCYGEIIVEWPENGRFLAREGRRCQVGLRGGISLAYSMTPRPRLEMN